MSDYEFCEKHKISYLIPEYLGCPYCFLEEVKEAFAIVDNDRGIDMLDQIIDDLRTKSKII